jgi:CBS domain-containing protein
LPRRLDDEIRKRPDQEEKAMEIATIMTQELVSLTLGDSIQEAARLLRKSGASSLPVVTGSGQLVGLVTETDLLARLRRPERAWWRDLFTDDRELAMAYEKRVGTTVAGVMRPAPPPVPPDLSLVAAAELLSSEEVRELPVVANGQLVGSVRRTDLLAVVAHERTGEVPTDEGLVAEMQTRLVSEAWWVSHRGIQVTAEHGVLILNGLVNTDEERAALGTMARTIAGCRGVENHLVAWRSLPARWL